MRLYSKFPGHCATCKASFVAGTLIDWVKGSGATHADPRVCASFKLTPPTPRYDVREFDALPIAQFLQAAKDRGLKWPKARFLGPNSQGEIVLSLAGARSQTPGAVNVFYGGEWTGRITPEGHVHGRLRGEMGLLEVLAAVAINPAKVAQEYGRMTCKCSFCNLPLKDEGSTEVGYGPVCAGKWGLPHTPKGVRVLTQTPSAI